MQSTRGSLAALVASAAVLAAGGCGGDQKPAAATASKVEATVTGKVAIRGKPATRGRINFEPLGADSMPTGSHVVQVGKDGTYTVTTEAGRNDVTVSGTGDQAVDSSYNKTNLEVKPGSNTLDLDLPLKP